MSEGWKGWDEYAPFYDWENARTLGRRDVPFWRRLALTARGPVLELGCGTGRISLPIARAGVDLVGIDRSAAMLDRARANRKRSSALQSIRYVRGDIRCLPFRDRAFRMVIAPYGILQSLITARDLSATLASVARMLPRGGVFGIDLVPDVPNWREYTNRVQLRGRLGASRITLIETVRQDPARRRTTFAQRYVVQERGRRAEHQFDLTFRTLTVPAMRRRLERAGFAIDAVLGDYRGRPWDERADVWIIVAKKV
jgi:ubiquinone/menaquinone biosynthesis C-methylase UbiE